jgi:hypothetical protein
MGKNARSGLGVVGFSFMIQAVTGCFTTADLDRRLNTWIGVDADALATAWGAPTGTYRKKNGEQILTYDKSSIITSGPGPFIQTFSRQCRVDIFTDPEGKIRRVTWQGDAGQCDRFTTPASGEPVQ